jgi:hypothetical protein
MTKLNGFLKVKQAIYESRVQILEDLIERVIEDKSFIDVELAEVKQVKEEIDAVLEENQTSTFDTESSAFMDAYKEFKGSQVVDLLDTILQHDLAHSKRSILYNKAHLHSNSEGLFNFRQELFQHLASNIYVKEHRMRYQQEQFERFLASLGNNYLYNSNMTL